MSDSMDLWSDYLSEFNTDQTLVWPKKYRGIILPQRSLRPSPSELRSDRHLIIFHKFLGNPSRACLYSHAPSFRSKKSDQRFLGSRTLTWVVQNYVADDLNALKFSAEENLSIDWKARKKWLLVVFSQSFTLVWNHYTKIITWQKNTFARAHIVVFAHMY